MQTLLLLLVSLQPPSDISFFKVFNKTPESIEIEITGKNFSQIATISSNNYQFIAVKEGSYLCGIKGGDKRSFMITPGQVSQIEFVQNLDSKTKEVPKDFKEAKKIAIDTGKPLIGFIGIPARDIDGLVTTHQESMKGVEGTGIMICLPFPNEKRYMKWTETLDEDATDAEIRLAVERGIKIVKEEEK